MLEMLLVVFMNEPPSAEVQEVISTESAELCYRRAYNLNNDDWPMSGICLEKRLWESLQDLNVAVDTGIPIFVGGQLVGIKPMTC